MITYEIDGLDSLLKTLRQKARVYRHYKSRILKNSSRLGLKITKNQWFGIGDDDIDIQITMSSNGFVVSVSGSQVLFLEFGAGITYESLSHPLASEFKYGPGTYNENSDNWKNRDGWYYYSNDPTKVTSINNTTGQGVAHTWGEPAWSSTYKSAVLMREEIKFMVIKELLRK